VNVTVRVIDGTSGRPAEGVKAAVVNDPAGGPSTCIDGLTDAEGRFTCRPDADLRANSSLYSIELDVDAYFISMGIAAGYKQTAFLARLDRLETDYLFEVFITPFGHATWNVK